MGALAFGLVLSIGQGLFGGIYAEQAHSIAPSAIQILDFESSFRSSRCDASREDRYEDSGNSPKQCQTHLPQPSYVDVQTEKESENDSLKKKKYRSILAAGFLSCTSHHSKKISESVRATYDKTFSTQTFSASPKRGPPVILS